MYNRFRRKKTNNGQQKKFGNKIVYYNGDKFASQKELDRYFFLLEKENSGEIHSLQKQVTFELIPPVKQDIIVHKKTKDVTKTKTLQRAITWTCDYLYYKGDELIIEDVKGSKLTITKDWELRTKLLFWRYGYKVRVVFKANEPV